MPAPTDPSSTPTGASAPRSVGTAAPLGPRARLRRELTTEIKDRALAQLAVGGGAALSLRAIAREMGMASSALFRYFANRDALLTALIIDTYGAIADAAEAADAAVRTGTVEQRWMAICRAVRAWAVAHPHEYALIFGSPIPGYAAPSDTVGPASRIPLLLGMLLADRAAQPDVDPAPAGSSPDAARAARAPQLATPPAIRDSLAPLYGTVVPAEVPPDLLVRGLMAWTYLFGAVSFEVFGHRHGVIADYAAFFDHEMARIAVLLGLV